MADNLNARKASVIIVTGYLGAGKTTLINRILTNDHGRKIAVIVNEFGAVGIDHHLLLSLDQEVVQMNNGCAHRQDRQGARHQADAMKRSRNSVVGGFLVTVAAGKWLPRERRAEAAQIMRTD